MKQRISTDQLNELTDKQKEKLRELWKAEKGDYYFDKLAPWREEWDVFWNEWPPSKEALPLLSIGQMIEILEDKESCSHKFISGTAKFWSVQTPLPKRYDEKELCDALWEAVKQVI